MLDDAQLRWEIRKFRTSPGMVPYHTIRMMFMGVANSDNKTRRWSLAFLIAYLWFGPLSRLIFRSLTLVKTRTFPLVVTYNTCTYRIVAPSNPL